MLPFLSGHLRLFSTKMNRGVENRFDFLCSSTGSRNRKVEMLLKSPKSLRLHYVFMTMKKLKFNSNNCLFHMKSTWKPTQWSGGVCCEQHGSCALAALQMLVRGHPAAVWAGHLHGSCGEFPLRRLVESGRMIQNTLKCSYKVWVNLGRLV